MLFLKCQLTSVFCTVVIPLEAGALQSSWKKISISPCQDKKEIRLLLRCKKYKEKASQNHKGILQFSPTNFTWQVVAGETRIHSQRAHSPLWIHWEQLVTQKQSFCEELNLDSVMNGKFQVTEKKQKPKGTTKQTYNEMGKSPFTLQAYCSAVLILRRNLVWNTICIEMLRVINFKKKQEAEETFGLHFTVIYSSTRVAR